MRGQSYPINGSDNTPSGSCLLGGLGKGPRTTANLCTPGTDVLLNGALLTTHGLKVELLNLRGCQDPKAKNYPPYFVAADPAACVV